MLNLLRAEDSSSCLKARFPHLAQQLISLVEYYGPSATALSKYSRVPSARLVGIELNPGPKKGSKRGSQNPPQITSNIMYKHRYRFTSSSGTATSITCLSAAGAVGGICTVVNSSLETWSGSVKIDEIEIWTPPASQGAAATCSVNWVSNFVSTNNQEVSDTTVSVGKPAHVCTRPPPMSISSFWQSASSTSTLCQITAPSGSIIDVVISSIISDDDTGPNPIAIGAGVLGNVYYLSLDPNATHRFTPISLTTTT